MKNLKQNIRKIEENLTGEGGWIAKITDQHGTVRYVNEFGELHRTDGPAQISKDGKQVYYDCGNVHRLDGPAIIEKDGSYYYYQYNKLHNENGPAVVQMLNGKVSVTEYRIYGKLHRLDGPALEWENGSYQYYKNGKYHREDGPAMCTVNEKNQQNTYEYYLNGTLIPKTIFKLYQLGSNIFNKEKKVDKVLDEIINDLKKRKM